MIKIKDKKSHPITDRYKICFFMPLVAFLVGLLVCDFLTRFMSEMQMTKVGRIIIFLSMLNLSDVIPRVRHGSRRNMMNVMLNQSDGSSILLGKRMVPKIATKGSVIHSARPEE